MKLIKDKPEPNKVYALTGGPGKKCIANGNTWSESVIKKVPIYNIYWVENGNRDFCGKTDNPTKWLEENNKRRYKDIVCGDEYEDDHEQKICSCIERLEQFEFKYMGEK